MPEVLDKKKIRKVFRDAQRHLAIADLIRRFSTNKNDIRKTALMQIDLSGCRHVLELGCAFGAFTEALRDRLHPDAKITGVDIIAEYRPFFLDACKRAGYEGAFSSSGIDRVKKFHPASFDLIICSYALYFFPEIIPDIARILKPDGFFVTITHSDKDMKEMVQIVKKIAGQSDSSSNPSLLPIEIIFDQFSAENGESLLRPCFKDIKSIEFKNSLIFQLPDIEHFMAYFQFKKSFFLSEHDANNKSIIHRLFQELQNTAMRNNFLTMCKDDKIFICSGPLTDRNPS